ncbi:response regulator transcription factor [Rhodocista pekingensis]|uniref:Response regulator transcription factor n=1 Tax=Rhodocista pekingensis TaxID=201185 RepID=A0ABW2L136_9PROT
MPYDGAAGVVVHIVDDEPTVLKALRTLLEADGFTCRTYEDGRPFLEAGVGERDCVIADVQLHDMTGIEMLQTLRARGQRTPVLVITGYASIEVAVEAMKAGATDFLTKPFEKAELVGKVRACLAIARLRASETARRRAAADKLAALSEREVEVLGQVIEGRTNRAIGDVLGISIKTVEAHRARIMEKTGALSLVDLTRLWDTAGPCAAL